MTTKPVDASECVPNGERATDLGLTMAECNNALSVGLAGLKGKIRCAVFIEEKAHAVVSCKRGDGRVSYDLVPLTPVAEWRGKVANYLQHFSSKTFRAGDFTGLIVEVRGQRFVMGSPATARTVFFEES